MKEELIKNVESTFNNMIQIFESFNEDDINKIPFEDIWTPGQLVRHVIKSGKGFVRLINGPVKDTNRPYDEFAESI